MNEETQENLNSQNEDVASEDDTQDTQSDAAEKSVEDRLAQLEAEVKEKNEQLFARAKKAEERNKKLRDALEDEPQTIDTTPQESSNQPVSDERFERLELKTDGYSDEETDYLMSIGGKKALKNKEVQDFIKYKRQKNQQEETTPAPSRRSVPTVNKQSVAELAETKEGAKKLKDNFESVRSQFKNRSQARAGVI